MVLFYNAPTKTSQRKKTQTATIINLDYQGLGVAKVAGKTWFIENGLPEENVQFVVSEEKRQYGIGKAVKWQNKSPIRREPLCSFYGQCGGCQMQHIVIEAQRQTKQRALLHQLRKIAPDLQMELMIADDEWHYRRRAKFSLQYSTVTKSVEFGFRQQQSNQLVAVTDCPILVPQLSQLLSPLRELFQLWQQPKKLGHIELVAADNGVALLLRHLGSLSATDEQNLRQFATQHQLMLFVSETDNQVSAWTEQHPYYQLEQLQLQFDVRDFIQVNPIINQRMVQTALAWLELSAKDRVLDLFCGMGNFSLPLAQYAEYVVGIEGVADMVSKASANAARNQMRNVAFYQTDLSASFADKAWAAEKFNKVLLDPPRAGALFALNHIVELQPERILYVSCNPATLVRDIQILVEHGYRLVKAAMIDMFPQTGHMESMVLLVK
ncbi:23S rRNA (uracil(1939)-C(5))-methyltransferase RlmD [Gallibacterium salpingitidis]|uniref:23S rRNA (uracil(1939)-C(5))-methyltransferase RlmD n=1 Tax=Gallibacterium salpingitidis TaxID=505341 RepID=A0A1A7NYR0_9PAST|nr:23S rRNA (uracil(1939)-C(5))-methyltransferase RlmD [Gallibacterium salpingitidis]OBW94134.1 23S rRNA methyltransferase [Gallibacterium salpingitidis]